MKCDNCHNQTFVIYIDKGHKKLCDDCYGFDTKEDWVDRLKAQRVTKYMSFNKDQFKNLIERVLKEFGMFSESAVNLLLGTAAQESGFGTYLKQLGNGPARGVFQMEPATEKDIWNNYIRYKGKLSIEIYRISGVAESNELRLEGNLIYQIIMARLHYRRVKEPLPDADDIKGLADYWKIHYNTTLGKGTTEEFIENYYKYIGV